jgi:hypothetical protein
MSFEYVISHELLHHYLRKNGLNISAALKGPFSPLESFAASLVEDIQLAKVAQEKEFYLAISDEVKKLTVYYDGLPIPDPSKFSKLPPHMRINAVISVSSAFAMLNRLCRVLNGELKKLAIKCRNLVAPHFRKVGYELLYENIRTALDEKVWKTRNEKIHGFERILECLDKWADENAPSLF